jgi:hypothetical protein
MLGDSVEWLAQISTALGVPTAGALLAGAVYVGSMRLEEQARPEALRDIAAFLKSEPRAVDLSLIAKSITHLFGIVFGPRHFSRHCLWRSFVASGLVVITIFLAIHHKHPAVMRTANDLVRKGTSPVDLAFAEFYAFLILCVIPDYVSLGKGRLMLRRVQRCSTLTRIGFWILLDLLASYLISMTVYWSLSIAFNRGKACWWLDGKLHCEPISGLLMLLKTVTSVTILMTGTMLRDVESFTTAQVFLFTYGVSTLLTSVWTFLVFVSASLMRLALYLAPALRLVRWFFDVDQHPIRVIGLMFATLIWMGSMFYFWI